LHRYPTIFSFIYNFIVKVILNKLKMKNKILTIICLAISFSSFSQENNQSLNFFSEFIDGRLMKTLEDNNHMISTSLKSISRVDGKYYIFDVYITNKSSTKTVLVDKFKAYISKGQKVYEGEVLTRKEYLDIKEKKAAWRAALVAAAGSFAAEDAGTNTKIENTSSSGSIKTNFSGSSQSSSDIYNSNGSFSGSVDTNTNFGGNARTNFNANSTTYTEEKDGAAIYAARQESARQVNEMMNIASEARKKWNEDYLSNNTLRNGETMSGLLNIKYKKGDKIVLKIIIDDFEYPFEWSPSESEN